MSNKQSIAGLTLLIPEKPDIERDQVAQAWIDMGGCVTRLGRFWEPPALDPRTTRIYANDTFAWVIAQKLGIELLSPSDDLPVHMPYEFIQRIVHLKTLNDLDEISFPAFIKSAVPKLFKATVYDNEADLRKETHGLELSTQILVSEIVEFVTEVRSFILDKKICDLARYEGNDQHPIDGAKKLIQQIAQSSLLPQACIIDVGFISGRGWALVEANAAWGGGLNGCRADKVVECIAQASRPEVIIYK